jgi:parallel beta-helix repeat protein
MTLERISTIGNRNHNVIGMTYQGTNATFTIDRSNLSESQIGNGVELQGGIAATINRTKVNGNGTDTANVPVTGGRAIVLTSNSTATVSNCTVNLNYDSAIFASNTSNLNLTNNTINSNGRDGVFYELQASGTVSGNDISFNGTRGAFGAGGYNGLEVNLSSGFSITISGNTFFANTANGIYADGGTANVLNNTFRDNFVGVTIANTRNVATSATVKGNLLELSPGRPYSEGVFLFSNTGASLTITIGSTVVSDKNTFRDYGSYPAIHCNPGSISATCPAGGNVFINSTFPVASCTSCSP